MMILHTIVIISRNVHSITYEDYQQWLLRLNATSTVYTSAVDYSHPLIFDTTSYNQPSQPETHLQSETNMAAGDMDSVCVEELSRLNITDKVVASSHSTSDDPSAGMTSEHMTVENEDGAVCKSGEASCDDPKYPVSFYDLMWMIENGEKIPGVDDINVEPTNELPTASCVSRAKKPWEL